MFGSCKGKEIEDNKKEWMERKWMRMDGYIMTFSPLFECLEDLTKSSKLEEHKIVGHGRCELEKKKKKKKIVYSHNHQHFVFSLFNCLWLSFLLCCHPMLNFIVYCIILRISLSYSMPKNSHVNMHFRYNLKENFLVLFLYSFCLF